MSQSYEQVLARLRDHTAFVHLDVRPPRAAPTKQLVAHMFEPKPGDEPPTRPHGQAVSVAITAEQARELLAAGAKWSGPAHLRAEVLAES